MEWSYIFLAFIGFTSGISATYLGMGGSIYIVPLLPLLTGLSPLETVKLSFLYLFVSTCYNLLIFMYRGLVNWPWFKMVASAGILSSFAGSFFLSHLSSLQIRFILWLFLGFILALPLFLQRLKWASQHTPYFAGALMGSCSGLTGLGGGLILSPILYESRKMASNRIPATACAVMLPISFFGLLAQMMGESFSVSASSHWWFCFWLLLIPSLVGLGLGHLLKAGSKITPRHYTRAILTLIFLALTGELGLTFLKLY